MLLVNRGSILLSFADDDRASLATSRFEPHAGNCAKLSCTVKPVKIERACGGLFVALFYNFIQDWSSESVRDA